MVHTYEEARQWVHSRLTLGIKPGLDRMQWLMERLGHPERLLKVIHVGGTNGKGSTVTYIRSILEEADYQVGTFTSPYVERFNERISINGEPISDEELIQLVNVLIPLVEQLEQSELGGPSEFEVITAMALYYFAKVRPVDIVVMEVGLGGRLDSTNVVHPIVTVITTIGMDHVQLLGDTIEQIAAEKAGIIKSGVPVVTAVNQLEALHIIRETAKSRKASIYELGKQFHITKSSSEWDGEHFTFESLFKTFPSVELRMLGKHQQQNAAVALMTALLLRTYYSFLIEEEHFYNGLKKAFWPGRFEVIQQEPAIILDGAHNPEGMKALKETVNQRYKGKNVTVLCAILEDKKMSDMVKELDEFATELVFTTFELRKVCDPTRLQEVSKCVNKRVELDWKEYVSDKISQMTSDDVLIITGSLYFISQLKPYLLQRVKM
jgi:dihydrofolate synthase / folylpolyglutamate synthase